MGRSRKAEIQQKMKNDMQWSFYMYRFAELAQGMYEWHNMGDFFDERFAEACLFFNGWVSIWYDEIAESFVCNKTIAGTGLDIYGNMKDSYIAAVNGYNRQLDTSNSVIVYNSNIRGGYDGFGNRPVSPFMMLSTVVEEMTLIHQSMMQNINSMGCPLIISGTPQQQLTLQNKVMQYDAKMPYIFVDSDFTRGADGDLRALNTNCPDRIASFSGELDKCWSEGLTYLGLDNMGQSKRERMLVDEVNANNEQVSMAAKAKLDARNNALTKLNKIYGSECFVTLKKGTMFVSNNGGYKNSPYNFEAKEQQEEIDVSSGGEPNG